MIILALIALVVIPPEKLPEFAKQIARLFNDIRRSTTGVWDDLKQEAMLKPEDLMKYKAPEEKTSPIAPVRDPQGPQPVDPNATPNANTNAETREDQSEKKPNE